MPLVVQCVLSSKPFEIARWVRPQQSPSVEHDPFERVTVLPPMSRRPFCFEQDTLA